MGLIEHRNPHLCHLDNKHRCNSVGTMKELDGMGGIGTGWQRRHATFWYVVVFFNQNTYFLLSADGKDEE